MMLSIMEDRVNDARQRLESIDEFRGFSILLMVLANYLAGPHVVPAWLKHAPDVGFTVIDIIAPMFIAAIGLTFGASFRARLARDGRRQGDRAFSDPEPCSHRSWRSFHGVGKSLGTCC